MTVNCLVTGGDPTSGTSRSPRRGLDSPCIDGYTTLLDELARSVTPEYHDLATQLAGLPETIGGDDTIEDEAAAQVKEKERLLIREDRRATPSS